LPDALPAACSGAFPTDGALRFAFGAGAFGIAFAAGFVFAGALAFDRDFDFAAAFGGLPFAAAGLPFAAAG
jgi:hypothetical protein